MSQTHLIPKKSLEEIERELLEAKHVRKRFDLTVELCRYMRKDLPRMLSLSQSAVELAEKHHLGLFKQARALWWVAFSYRHLQQYEQSVEVFNKVLDIARNTTQLKSEGISDEELGTFGIEIHDNIAIDYFYLGKLEKAMEHFMVALDLSKKHVVSGGIIAAHNSLGEIWRMAGNIEKAYIEWNNALNASYQYQDLRRVAEILTNLSSTHEFYGEIEKAVYLINRALQHARDYHNDYGICVALLSRARLNTHTGQWQDVENDIEECLEIAQIYRYLEVEIQARINLGTAYQQQQRIKEATALFSTAYNSAEEKNELTFCAQSALGLAQCYGKSRNNKKARTWALKALALSAETRSNTIRMEALRHIADIELALHNSEASNRYLRECIELMEEINREQHTNEVREAKMRLSMESAERERRELAIKTAELEHRLEEKRAELASLAMAISQKNAVIEKLSKRLEEVANTQDASYSERCKTMVHEIELLKHSGEEQWSNLQIQFESMDADFRARLMEKFPALTQYEIKVCLLMRLNLSSKDIANILWSSLRTIETHRYQIRKKLSLNKDENLFAALARV